MNGRMFQEDFCWLFLFYRIGLIFFWRSNYLEPIRKFDEMGLACRLKILIIAFSSHTISFRYLCFYRNRHLRIVLSARKTSMIY